MTSHSVSIERDPESRDYRLETALWLPAQRDTVFGFFADARNLDRITPPWLQFRILTPAPIVMKQGLLLDYSLRIHGVPIRWQSEITTWDPPYRFVDEQRRGPYLHWIHEHLFLPRNGGTEVIDRVDYAVPGGRLVHGAFVKRDVTSIFQYRRRELSEVFRSSRESEGEAPMRAAG